MVFYHRKITSKKNFITTIPAIIPILRYGNSKKYKFRAPTNLIYNLNAVEYD